MYQQKTTRSNCRAIKVQPSLKCYLRERFGKEEQFTVRTPPFFLKFNLVLLGKEPILQKHNYILLYFDPQHSTQFSQEPKLPSKIKRYLQSVFEAELCSHIRALRSKKVTTVNAIYHFWDLFDLDEDIFPLKTAEMIWYRYQGPK